MKRKFFLTLLGLLCLLFTAHPVYASDPVGTAFTYQGQLKRSGGAYTGTCDMQFSLYDAATGNGQFGSTVTKSAVSVASGLFTTQLDFGNQFARYKWYLEIAVQCTGDAGYTTLTPRQELTPTPYALYATNAADATTLGGFSQYEFLKTAGGVVGPLTVGNNRIVVAGVNSNVGIGTTTPGSLLTAAGTIESTSGGFKFPDGTTQTTAATTDWKLSGNSGTTGGTNFIGTTDNVPFEIRMSNIRVWRATAGDPVGFANIISGNSNSVGPMTNGATIGGGHDNYVEINISTIAGGWFNTASGGTIGGGGHNTVAVGATVSGGDSNTASGAYSSISGGSSNTAAGDYSFVTGRRAKNSNAAHDGVFMFADGNDFDFSSTAANQFRARATGGVQFVTGINGTTGADTAGVLVAAGGGSWSSLSDRNAKQNFSPINSREILQRVANIPILKWNYKSQDAGVQHIGPMAQDFAAAFSVGEDDKHITTVDADGVALAAIQGLNEIVQAQQAEINTLKIMLGVAVFGVVVCLGMCAVILGAVKQSMVANRGAAK